MSAVPAAGGIVIPPSPPRSESDPVQEVIDAWDWARDFFNRRASEYAVLIEAVPASIARALG